jgi:uncharacterized membrane protein YoaT (DUF817 family)
MCKFIAEFWMFGLRQAWACLFGGLLLAAILLSKLIWQPEWALARYDALFVFAVLVQVILLATGLETKREAVAIFVFHIVGTIMEIFKTEMGSWVYPEENLIRIYGVPLFTGFMYSSVGSYMMRVMHVLDLRFSNYPPQWMTALLGVLIYINFFTHHYIWDARYLLIAAVIALWWRSWLYFKPVNRYYRMPVVVGFLLTAGFIWLAENIGTFGRIWIYPGQEVWHPVSIAKLGSWFLLMIISCVLVTWIKPPQQINEMKDTGLPSKEN